MKPAWRRICIFVGLSLIVSILRADSTSGNLWVSILAGIGCFLVATGIVGE